MVCDGTSSEEYHVWLLLQTIFHLYWLLINWFWDSSKESLEKQDTSWARHTCDCFLYSHLPTHTHQNKNERQNWPVITSEFFQDMHDTYVIVCDIGYEFLNLGTLGYMSMYNSNNSTHRHCRLTCIYAACKAEENHVSAEELGKGIEQDHHMILDNEMLVLQVWVSHRFTASKLLYFSSWLILFFFFQCRV